MLLAGQAALACLTHWIVDSHGLLGGLLVKPRRTVMGSGGATVRVALTFETLPRRSSQRASP